MAMPIKNRFYIMLVAINMKHTVQLHTCFRPVLGFCYTGTSKQPNKSELYTIISERKLVPERKGTMKHLQASTGTCKYQSVF